MRGVLLLLTLASAPPDVAELERRLVALESRIAELSMQIPQDDDRGVYLASLRRPNVQKSLLAWPGGAGGLSGSGNCLNPSAACSAASFTTTGTSTAATYTATVNPGFTALAADAPSTPGFSFTGATNYGMYKCSGGLCFSVGGSVAINANAGTGAISAGSGFSYQQAMGTATGVGTGGPAISAPSTNVTVVGNGADTTEDNLMTFSLPANSMSGNGKVLRFTAWGDNNGISTTDVLTVRCYFGATAVFTRILTASQTNTWRVRFEVVRTGAATQVTSGDLLQQGTAQFWQQLNGTAAEALSGAVVVKCTGQRATTPTANSVRQLGQLVEFMNN